MIYKRLELAPGKVRRVGAALLTIVPALIFGICSFALLETVVRRRNHEYAQHPLPWLGLLAILLALEPTSKLPFLAIGFGIAGPLWFALYKGAKKWQPYAHPEALLLEFCRPWSTAIAGGISALFVALFLYSLGLLGDLQFWTTQGAWRLFLIPFGGGALLALLRQSIRKRKPQPVWVPYVFRRRLDGTGVWAEGQGLWLDEIILPIVVTPALWMGLHYVAPGWSGFFMFGLFLPTLAFYLVWTFVNRFWLRLVGLVDRTREMEYLAYDLLVGEPSLARWMGEVAVKWDGEGFRASGMLPGQSERFALKRALDSLAKPVDVSAVELVPGLRPNPWFQLALIRQKRRKLWQAS